MAEHKSSRRAEAEASNASLFFHDSVVQTIMEQLPNVEARLVGKAVTLSTK
jgi:hypothetical protein